MGIVYTRIPNNISDYTEASVPEIRAFLRAAEEPVPGCLSVDAISAEKTLLPDTETDIQFCFLGNEAEMRARTFRDGLNNVKEVFDLPGRYFASVGPAVGKKRGFAAKVDNQLLKEIIGCFKKDQEKFKQAFRIEIEATTPAPNVEQGILGGRVTPHSGRNVGESIPRQ